MDWASRIIKRLEHTIYDKYLDRINLLSKEEVQNIVFAYTTLRRLLDILEEGNSRIERLYKIDGGEIVVQDLATRFSPVLSREVTSTARAFTKAMLLKPPEGEIFKKSIKEVLDHL